MAKKNHTMRLALTSREPAELNDRWPEQVSPALYMMQLRLPKLRISQQKRKLPVITEPDGSNVPQFVKIRHIA